MAALALILLDWVPDYIENHVKIWTTSWRTDTLCSCTQTENCVVHSNLIGYFNMHHNPFSTVQLIAWRSTCLQIQWDTTYQLDLFSIRMSCHSMILIMSESLIFAAAKWKWRYCKRDSRTAVLAVFVVFLFLCTKLKCTIGICILIRYLRDGASNV
jgi:hypothetical protein